MNKNEIKCQKIEQEMKRKISLIQKRTIKEVNKVKNISSMKISKLNQVQKVKVNNNVIPIFYASDKNYLPYLSVSLDSLKANRNKKYQYEIYILHSGIEEQDQQVILSQKEKKFNVTFVNVNNKLEEIKEELQIRDYYTGATYYRIFIANMFKEYQKAIYLDSDTIVLGDISLLYKYNLKNNLVGAIPDMVVSHHPIFRNYCSKVLGIDPENYFNAGILLMNLKQIRSERFFEKFTSLLKEYKFVVAQDQDYLNVLCKNKVRLLPKTWNTMPVVNEDKIKPSLIHYNLTLKPWHYGDIPFSNCFWKYVKNNPYSDVIRQEFGNHNLEKQARDLKMEENLINLAINEIEREDNYLNVLLQKENNLLDIYLEEEMLPLENNEKVFG